MRYEDRTLSMSSTTRRMNSRLEMLGKVWRRGMRVVQATGATNRRNMYWARYSPYNFGDWVGPYIFQRLTGKLPLHSMPSRSSRQTIFFAAGSIMKVPTVSDQAIIWGSGILSKTDVFPKPRQIHAVRGPYTQRRCSELGYQCPSVYGDPAILLPDFFTPTAVNDRRIGIIPHFADYQRAQQIYSGDSETVIIDVTQPIEKVIEAICSCSATVSSSLHGLIVSHAYGVPSGWVEFSNNLAGDGIKFMDYLHSAGDTETVRPLRVKGYLPPDILNSYALKAIAPDLDRLRGPLRASCPFR